MTGFRRDAQGRALLGGKYLYELLQTAGVSTPAYVYDVDAIADQVRALVAAFGAAPGLVAYAVKANSAGTIVRTVTEAGGGADVVSGAELELALHAGVAPRKIVMSGVAKTSQELDLAIERSILAIQAESIEELARIQARASSLGKRARVALRIKPGVEIDSHAHIQTGHDAAKFGIALDEAASAFNVIDDSSHLDAVGVSTHVGSMLSEVAPYLSSAERVVELLRSRNSKQPLEYANFGGGFGIDYGSGPVDPGPKFIREALELLKRHDLSDKLLVVEPGRSVVGPYGVLVAKVTQSKESGGRRWIMIDAGMNDLLRPALYSAHHRVEPLDREPGEERFRVVGPVCESSDDFGEHPLGTVPEYVAIRDAGAYGFSMASEYNGRALPSEVFVSGGRVKSVSRSPGTAHWIQRRLNA